MAPLRLRCPVHHQHEQGREQEALPERHHHRPDIDAGGRRPEAEHGQARSTEAQRQPGGRERPQPVGDPGPEEAHDHDDRGEEGEHRAAGGHPDALGVQGDERQEARVAEQAYEQDETRSDGRRMEAPPQQWPPDGVVGAAGGRIGEQERNQPQKGGDRKRPVVARRLVQPLSQARSDGQTGVERHREVRRRLTTTVRWCQVLDGRGDADEVGGLSHSQHQPGTDHGRHAGRRDQQEHRQGHDQ